MVKFGSKLFPSAARGIWRSVRGTVPAYPASHRAEVRTVRGLAIGSRRLHLGG